MRNEVKEFKSLVKNVNFDKNGKFKFQDPIPLEKGTILRHSHSSGTTTLYIFENCNIVAIDEYDDVILDKSACSHHKGVNHDGIKNFPAVALPMNILQILNNHLV